jgi:photosystem II stability/assembly factor-like uncharacterized protein
MKKINPQTTWSEIHGPAGGSVSCLAVIAGKKPIILIGSQIGIFRSTWDGSDGITSWSRLISAPLGVLSLAIASSPDNRPFIFAGTTDGIYVSQDLGQSWFRARLPLSSSTILTLAVSPNFSEDRIALAGTLEDGIFYSNNSGQRWQSQSFGMLDSSVFSIAFSPSFVEDGTVFAGTESGIYHSYNHALAWKAVEFSEELAPVLCLAVSPHYKQDHLIFAGTETEGLYSSSDLGEEWQKTNLPASCVNALLYKPSGVLLAATNQGLFQSDKRSLEWFCQVDLPDAMTLASKGGIHIAGFLENGAWFSTGEPGDGSITAWKSLGSLSIRGFTQMVISKHFEVDRTLILASPQEGIWRTQDGGDSWQNLTGSFPGDSINHISLSPFSPQPAILISADNGLFLSQNSGDAWLCLAADPCNVFALTVDGRTITAAFPGKGIRKLTLTGREALGGLSAQELQDSWEVIHGPWEKGGQILTLACQKDQMLHVALLENLGQTLNLYQGTSGEIEPVHSQPAGDIPLVSLWIPSEPAPDRPWFACLGEKVWKFSARRGGISEELTLFPDGTREPIIGLTGVMRRGKSNLFACTGRAVYHLGDGTSWKAVHDFGDERAIDFCLSPRFIEEPAAYALALGGKILFGRLPIG